MKTAREFVSEEFFDGCEFTEVTRIDTTAERLAQAFEKYGETFISPDVFSKLTELVAVLTKEKMAQCSHLQVENFAPPLLAKLLQAASGKE